MSRLALLLAASLASALPALAQTGPAAKAPSPASAPGAAATPSPAPATSGPATPATGTPADAPAKDSATPGPAKQGSEPAAPPKALPRGAVLEEVAGTIREVDLQGHRLSLQTASGPVTLTFDRNTMVYTTAGLGTVLDLAGGAPVRAGRNADFLAYWVQVRAASPGDAGPAAGSGNAPPPGTAKGPKP